MADNRERGPRLPPRWFIRLAWSTHRAICQVTGGRLGLWRPKPGRWGTLRLTTTGRRTGQPRSVIVGYFQDGPNLVTLAALWVAGEYIPRVGKRGLDRAPRRSTLTVAIDCSLGGGSSWVRSSASATSRSRR
jgi:hypothetical protein